MLSTTSSYSVFEVVILPSAVAIALWNYSSFSGGSALLSTEPVMTGD